MKCDEADNPILKVIDELGYSCYWGKCEAKGRYGSCILSKSKPTSVKHGIGQVDDEGRAITLEFESFYLINTYVPNSGEGLKFKQRRLDWDKAMKLHLKTLQETKPVIWTGD
eukprot:UN34883